MDVKINDLTIKANQSYMLVLSIATILFFWSSQITTSYTDWESISIFLFGFVSLYLLLYSTQYIYIKNNTIQKTFLYGLIKQKPIALNDLERIKFNRDGRTGSFQYTLYFKNELSMRCNSYDSGANEFVNFVRYHMPDVQIQEPNI